jgi:outer membrane biosynthesis protein TonB
MATAPPSSVADSPFVPPRVLNATDIPYPVNTTVPGIVTLLLRLDSAAKIQNVQILRDVPPLTSAAQSAIQSWTFAAATRNGHPVAARLSLSIVFNPFNPGGISIEGLKVPLPPTPPGPEDSDFDPPQVTSGQFAIYPVNSIASGTVIFDVTIDKSGGVAKVHVIRGVPSLTPQSIKAVKSWEFRAATYKDQPVASHMVVAFVFPSPAIANPA